MIEKLRPWLPRGRDVYPLGLLILAVIGLFVVAPLAGSIVSSFNIYDILQNIADYGLVALALGLTMIMREYDISTAGTYAAAGVVAITLGQSSPYLGVVVAVAIGLGAGLIQGAAVAGFKMSSVPVTLGGYIALIGLSRIVAHDLTVSSHDASVGIRLDDPIAGIFSIRSLIVLGAFVVCGVVMRTTTIGAELRAVGGDRRGARSAGVPVSRILLVTMIVAGGLSALGGSLSALSLSSANPDLQLTPLLIGTIAVLLGGVALSGGRGSAWGILAGVAAYATLQETIAILGAADWLGDLVTGTLLVLVTVATAPDLLRLLAASRSRRRSRQSTGAQSTDSHAAGSQRPESQVAARP